MPGYEPNDIYKGEKYEEERPPLLVTNDDQTQEVVLPIRFDCRKPEDVEGNPRDQTNDAAAHMRYAASLDIPHLKRRELPKLGRLVVVGGAPSIKNHLEDIRKLAEDPHNAIFALNWSHTWLLQNGIVPKGCVFFEIDAEPDTVLEAAHPDVTYYICSHCHPRTFDALAGHKRVLWHTPPNSEAEKLVGEEVFKGEEMCGGGISTFTRTIVVGMFLGYRNFDLFGCDSSYPEEEGSHVKGYETVMDDKKDGLYVWAVDDNTKEIRKFRTLGYLALQHEEFKQFCTINHAFFTMRVWGDSLLRFTHSRMWPQNYEDE